MMRKRRSSTNAKDQNVPGTPEKKTARGVDTYEGNIVFLDAICGNFNEDTFVEINGATPCAFQMKMSEGFKEFIKAYDSVPKEEKLNSSHASIWAVNPLEYSRTPQDSPSRKNGSILKARCILLNCEASFKTLKDRWLSDSNRKPPFRIKLYIENPKLHKTGKIQIPSTNRETLYSKIYRHVRDLRPDIQKVFGGDIKFGEDLSKRIRILVNSQEVVDGDKMEEQLRKESDTKVQVAVSIPGAISQKTKAIMWSATASDPPSINLNTSDMHIALWLYDVFFEWRQKNSPDFVIWANQVRSTHTQEVVPSAPVANSDSAMVNTNKTSENSSGEGPTPLPASNLSETTATSPSSPQKTQSQNERSASI